MKNSFKNYSLAVLTILFLFSCDNISKEAENRLNELKNKTDSLDSLINKEVDKVKTLDTLIEKERNKVKKLDTLINKTSSRLDNILK